MTLRWFAILSVYGLFALAGCSDATQIESSPYTLTEAIASFACGIFTTSWAVSDSRKRGHPIVHILQLLMFLTWTVAIPIYLIWSRGWKGLGWAVLHCIGVIATTAVFFFAAEWASAQ